MSILKGCLCLLRWLTHLRHQNCNLQLYRQILAAQSHKVCLMLSFPVSLHARLPPLSKTLCPYLLRLVTGGTLRLCARKASPLRPQTLCS